MRKLHGILISALLFLAPLGAMAQPSCQSGMVFSEGKAQLEAAGVKVGLVPQEAADRAAHDYNEANGTNVHVSAVYLAVLGGVAKIIFVDGDCVVFATPAIPLQQALDLLGLSAT